MGTVYAARHAIIDKRVAIKVLRKEAAADESLGAALHHRGQGRVEDRPPEHRRHHRLRRPARGQRLLRDGVSRRADARQAGPRAQARAAGARHRHLHPDRARPLRGARQVDHPSRSQAREHLRRSRRTARADFVKIVDFGIAKDVKAGKRLTAVGMVLGTPEYMSPEQATGQETDHRVDQYALGCILYEMLTGDVPFKGENAPKTLTKHVFDAVVPPSKLRPDLEIPVVARRDRACACCRRSRRDRYADMRALIDALEAALAKIDAGRRAGAQDRRRRLCARPMAPPTDMRRRSCRATRRRSTSRSASASRRRWCSSASPSRTWKRRCDAAAGAVAAVSAAGDAGRRRWRRPPPDAASPTSPAPPADEVAAADRDRSRRAPRSTLGASCSAPRPSTSSARARTEPVDASPSATPASRT